MTETNLLTGPLALTPAAISHLKRLIARRTDGASIVRIGVKGGGCSGLSYTMAFEPEASERDLTWEQDGVAFAVDPRAERFLSGAQLDYSVKNLLEGGWVWSNPNAERSCGCGTSFTPKH